jgi:hypothetical protein
MDSLESRRVIAFDAADAEAPNLEHAEGTIVAVIPAHDEERFIGSVVLEAIEYVHAVIVVDDGSGDRTAEVAERAGAIVVRLPQQSGKGAALNAGFERSRAFHPDVVVTLDGDAQHDPAEIPVVAAPILGRIADVVLGSRFKNVKSRVPWWRIVGQHGLTLLTNAASGVKVTDSQTGYRAFSPRALDTLRFETTGLSVESEMQFLFQRRGLSVAEVGIHVAYHDRRKRNPVRHGLSIVDSMMHLVARRHPLLIVGGPGLILSAAGILMGVLGLDVGAHGQSLPVALLAASVVLLLVGLVLGVTATLLHSLERFAERVGEQLDEILGRPPGRGRGQSA